MNVASAELRLPGLFSEHAVLQADRPIPVWGWADSGAEVAVEFQGNTVTTTAADGRWIAHLPGQQPGGPYVLKVRSGSEEIVRTNVLVGEVWVGSGQSNMEWPMTRTANPGPAIERSADSSLRLFTVPKRKSGKPVDDVDAKWVVCEPGTVANFSAVAYYFGAALRQARNVPVGLIHSSWGGSPAEVWIREEVLEEHPEFRRDILEPGRQRRSEYARQVAEWERQAQEARSRGEAPPRQRPQAGWDPAELYNGMISPLIPYAIAGVIWYQGESNAGRADQYARLFPTMVRNWRDDWGQGDFPFLQVQLAPWDKNRNRSLEDIAAKPGDSDWAELREAQWIATRILPDVGMAVITDVGDKDDIHPAEKKTVGERLALLARHMAYKESIPHSGPMYRRVRIADGKARVEFAHADGGLVARDGELKGFQICGPDRKWVWAKAEIDGAEVIVWSPDVPRPVAVRYGWADYPIVNLYNGAGLPASPFRTDGFPLTTAR